MLNLLDPVQVEGLVVFRDDEDPAKFFLLPDQPVIPQDDRGEPDFLFLRYINDLQDAAVEEEEGAGFVQFRTALRLDEGKRERVLASLRARLVAEQAAGTMPFGHPVVRTEPLLAAPVWLDGTVDLSTFAVSDTGLVRHATTAVPVDLTGDLSAMLAVQLDADGAEVFWTAFEGRGEHHIPISVQFNLTYQARVSARMEIHAKHEVIHREVVKWARPYRLMMQPFARYVALPGIDHAVAGDELQALRATWGPLRLCVPQTRVTETIREAINKNLITVSIQTDQATTGAQGAKVQDDLFAIATDVLTERVIPAMFGSGGGRPGAGSEQDTTATTSVLEVGEGGPPGDSSFDLVLDHNATVPRSIHPNGPVQVLLGSDAQLTSCFKTLRLSDRALASTQITASTSGVDFDADGIVAIHVWFSYEHTDQADPAHPVVKRQFDGLLTKPEDVVRWRFDLARGADKRHLRDYLYKVDVLYRDGHQTESLWQRGIGRSLLVTPAAMGAIKVDLVLTAPTGWVDGGATVDLRYTPPATGTGPVEPLETSIELSPPEPRQTWFQFTGQVGEQPEGPVRPPTYEYRVHYRIHGSEVVTDWRSSADRLLEIGTPFSKVLTFVVRPQGSFEGVASVSGDLEYRDERSGYTVTEPFELTSLAASHTFTVGVLPGGPEEVSWRARLTRSDGSGTTLGPGTSAPGTVWVGTDVDFLSIKVVADLVDFTTDVKLAVVQLTYDDRPHEIHQVSTMTFSQGGPLTQEWKVARSDRSKDRYDAHIRYVAHDRSRSSEVDHAQIDDQVLLLERS